MNTQRSADIPVRNSKPFAGLSAGASEKEKDSGEDRGMSAELQESEIGEFPSSWDIDRVDSVFEIQQGKQVSKKNREGDNQRPFLRTKNVFWNRLELSELDQMNFTENEETRLELQPGDLLTCEGGDIGRTALWKGDVERCYYQNHLHRLRSENGRARPQFAVYWFWYSFNVAKLYFGRGNVTTIPNLSRSKLAELPMALPPLPEQKKFAHILSTVQRAIEAQERIIQTTTELKKALMHKLFTEGLRNEPQKQTEIGPVPESWEVVPLGKYARVLNGYAFKSADYVPDGVRLIRISNVSIGFLIDKDDKYLPTSYLQERSAYALKEGDLILSLTRPIIKEGMKYCFIEKQHLPALLNQRVGIFEITDKRLRKDFLFQIIFSPYFINPLKYMAEGSNQPNVSPTRLEAFQIPIPTDMEEQEEIAKLLTGLNRKMELAKQKGAQLKDLFRTLLHELMTANTRVHEI